MTTVDNTVEAVAKHVVAQLAPRELDLFDDTAAALRRRAPDATRHTADDLLGFGVSDVEPVLTIAALLGAKAALAAFGQETGRTLAASSVQRAQRALGRLLRRTRHSSSGTLTPLADEQKLAVRDAALKAASAAGLPRKQAELLADAIVGQLTVRAVETTTGRPQATGRRAVH